MSALPQLPSAPGALEAHFAPFRRNTLGQAQTLRTLLACLQERFG